MKNLKTILLESLLDDEADLVNDKHIEIEDLYKKIFSDGYIKKELIYIDNKLNIYINGYLSSYMNQAYDNLFGGKIVNEIKEMSTLSLAREDRFFEINKKPITIDKIHNLHLTDEFINNPKSKNLKIKEADTCEMVVLGHQYNWIKYIKNIKINKLKLYCHWDHRVGDPQQIHNFKGINVDELSIGVESFKDWVRTPHTKKFDTNSEDNKDILDLIYANNKFNKLFITNQSDYAGTQFVVEKTNTKRRYKFKQIKLT